jgi:D-aminopeptidase
MKARDTGIVIGSGTPGPHNAITDVPGVRVGHATIIEGKGSLDVGRGPVRTGVTVILPHDGDVWDEPLFAGSHTLNGNGEVTGLDWVKESGMLSSPIALTNTHSVGTVRDSLLTREVRRRKDARTFVGLPVVGETWDGLLNDINGFHVDPEHVYQALEAAAGGPVPEGGVGGGTGMICHEFKGGIGTASRRLPIEAGGFSLGVLVQANHGRRERLQINGVMVGEVIGAEEVPVPEAPESAHASGRGSIVAIVATDAPLLPTQCDRLAQRVGLGVARTGGVGEHSSGDIFLAFSTGNRGMPPADGAQGTPHTLSVTFLSNEYITQLFDAVVEATEEAIVNALVAAETMEGRDGVTAYRLDGNRLLELIRHR